MRASPLFKYNPGQSSPQEIEATFVAREQVLAGILKDLRSRGRSKSNQHYLIIGPRGIGKTNLLVMIKQQVSNDKALAKNYLPIQTAEEEYSITGLRDLVTRILELISHQPDRNLGADLQSLRTIIDDEEAAEHAISALKGFSGKIKQKILLLVDNLDLILGNQFSDDAQVGRLRDLLMNESFLVLVGTAPTYFSEVSGYDRPLYNFFKMVHLEELTLEELTDLLTKRAEWDQNKAFLENLEQIKPKLRALHHLTGGNPRLVLILYQLLTQTTLPEIQADLQMLLDDLTPYYKARLESLPAQQRKVMDTFARLGRPATPTELAGEIRFPVNQVNSILQRLREHGFVAPARQKRRKTTLYVVSERVFRVWHQMRFSPESRRRLEFLIEFIRIWYSAEEWTNEAGRLISEYRRHAGEKHFAEAAPYLDHLDYLIQGAPKPELAYDVEDEVVLSCIKSGDCERAREILEKRIGQYELEGNQKRLAESWYLLARAYSEMGKPDRKISALEKAVQLKPDFPAALYNLGNALINSARMKEGQDRMILVVDAIQKYERTLKIKPDMYEALNNLGSALTELAGMKEEGEREILLLDAIEKCERALKIKPGSYEALNSLGRALSDLAITKEGEERDRLLHEATGKYEEAVQAKPDQPGAFNNLGVALMDLALMKEGQERERLVSQSIEKYKSALESKPDTYYVLNNWGNALMELALMKKGKEQEGLLDFALEKTATASHLAKTSGDMKSLSSCSSNHIEIALIATTVALFSNDIGRAREYFTGTLDKFSETNRKFASNAVVIFFRSIAKEKSAEQLAMFLDMIRERSMTDEFELLMPFAKAVEYWQKGKDEEVLDRLNPEIRELVEKIIQGTPERSSND